MTYQIKSICRQYGISKEEVYRAINNEAINADDKGDLVMDATLNAFLKRYRELAIRIPKKATVITEDDAGRVYNDGGTFYAVKSDYTILVTNDLMTANRYITPKEKTADRKEYPVMLNKLELLFLSEYPALTKMPSLKYKLNKVLDKASNI